MLILSTSNQHTRTQRKKPPNPTTIVQHAMKLQPQWLPLRPGQTVNNFYWNRRQCRRKVVMFKRPKPNWWSKECSTNSMKSWHSKSLCCHFLSICVHWPWTKLIPLGMPPPFFETSIGVSYALMLPYRCGISNVYPKQILVWYWDTKWHLDLNTMTVWFFVPMLVPTWY